MEVLLEAGADVNQIETLSHSPLTLAAERGQKEAIKFLIEKGADVNDVNHMYTALARAAMFRQHDCVNTLLKAGADVNMVVNMGYTALLYAAQSGSHSCVKLLIQAGADVNVRNTDGNTALSSAANGTKINVTLSNACNRELRLDVNTGAGVNGEDNEVDIENEQNASGIKINLVNKSKLNALRSYISNCEDKNKIPDRTMVLLLYAAGETLDGIPVDRIHLLNYLQEREISLKNICRYVIRKHLLDLDPHTHLFGRVPRLGLPRSLGDYLLYGQSLRSDSSSDVKDTVTDII